eukprot:gene8768-6169_t
MIYYYGPEWNAKGHPQRFRQTPNTLASLDQLLSDRRIAIVILLCLKVDLIVFYFIFGSGEREKNHKEERRNLVKKSSVQETKLRSATKLVIPSEDERKKKEKKLDVRTRHYLDNFCRNGTNTNRKKGDKIIYIYRSNLRKTLKNSEERATRRRKHSISGSLGFGLLNQQQQPPQYPSNLCTCIHNCNFVNYLFLSLSLSLSRSCLFNFYLESGLIILFILMNERKKRGGLFPSVHLLGCCFVVIVFLPRGIGRRPEEKECVEDVGTQSHKPPLPGRGRFWLRVLSSACEWEWEEGGDHHPLSYAAAIVVNLSLSLSGGLSGYFYAHVFFERQLDEYAPIRYKCIDPHMNIVCLMFPPLFVVVGVVKTVGDAHTYIHISIYIYIYISVGVCVQEGLWVTCIMRPKRGTELSYPLTSPSPFVGVGALALR